jgi:tRNA(fMet)-specific endonuclease VapC
VILLDSDHVAVLVESRQKLRDELIARLDATRDVIGLPIIVVEEQLRGWLAEIHRVRDPHKQIVPYLRLAKLVDFLGAWSISDWNEAAADKYKQLRQSRIRIGTQDLKIAAIAIACDATLLSANLQDFEKVPGLRVEDWLYNA